MAVCIRVPPSPCLSPTYASYDSFRKMKREIYIFIKKFIKVIYTGASCNHIVYTAGTSGTVKRQYAKIWNTFFFHAHSSLL